MQSILRCAVVLVAALLAGSGCAPIDIGGLSGYGGCSSDCDEVIVGPPSTVLLLGDTMTMNASTPGGYSDITWKHTLAVDFVGSPFVTNFFGETSHVVVIGKIAGLATITASRKNRSATATIEIIPATALRSLVVTRYCYYTHTGSCAGLHLNPAEQIFHDSLAVGDSALVTPKLLDNLDRSVKASVQWSTTNSSIAGVSDRLYTGTMVGAVSPGVVLITAKAGGKEAAFVLTVYKR